MHTQTKEQFFKGYDIFSLPLSVFAKAIYFYLCKCKNKDNTCFPSHFDISVKVGCSVSKVKLALKELEVINLIKKDNRFFESKKGKHAQTSNLYTIYSYPHIQIDNDASIVSEISIDVNVEVIEPIVENNKPTVQPSCDYELNTLPNNIKPKENKSINLSNVSPFVENKNDMIDSLDYIFNNCMLDMYDKSTREILTSTIINIYSDITKFSKRKNLPQLIIHSQLMKLTVDITDEAMSNYQYALRNNYKIDNYGLYFESCLWNASVNAHTSNIMMSCVS